MVIYGYYVVIRDESPQLTSEQNHEQQSPLLVTVTTCEYQTPILPIDQKNYGSISSCEIIE